MQVELNALLCHGRVRHGALLGGLALAAAACATPAEHLLQRPRGMFFLRGGDGRTSLEFDPAAEVEGSGWLAEFGVEQVGADGLGFGVRVGVSHSRDRLSGTGEEARVRGAWVFPHLTVRPAVDSLRCSVRFGVDGRMHGLTRSGDEFDYGVWAFGVEAEPEFDLFRTDDAALSVYGAVHGGFGEGRVGTDEYGKFAAYAVVLDAEAGVRWKLANVLLSAGWMSQSTEYLETDEQQQLAVPFVPETTFGYSGVFFAMGVSW